MCTCPAGLGPGAPLGPGSALADLEGAGSQRPAGRRGRGKQRYPATPRRLFADVAGRGGAGDRAGDGPKPRTREMLAAMNLRRSTAVIVILLCACARSPGAPGPNSKMCTEIGCADGLTITMAKGSPWEPGAYTFAFELDGAPVTCTGALPLKACESGPSLTCDPSGRVQIAESGCALPPEQHGFSDIRVPTAVTTLKLSIARDGQPPRSFEFAPKFVETRPNGPDCEPVCRQAAERVDLP